jgi:hypothetical protein
MWKASHQQSNSEKTLNLEPLAQYLCQMQLRVFDQSSTKSERNVLIHPHNNTDNTLNLQHASNCENMHPAARDSLGAAQIVTVKVLPQSNSRRQIQKALHCRFMRVFFNRISMMLHLTKIENIEFENIEKLRHVAGRAA